MARRQEEFMSIQVNQISKQFGQFKALDNVTLDFATGALTALLGPSGCGKTTLLRIIAGLESQDRGNVFLEGEDASDRHVRERQVGFVFQHYALFKHMTVFENVAFGLRVKPRRERPSESEIRRKVMELLDLVQLAWLADRYPAQLSGGQRQRIALARALAVEPRVLLLDEPFGALDAKVRKELRRWLRRLHDDLHVTSIFVTHDQEEALEVADQIVVLNKGKVEQIGTPAEVYDHPATPFVYSFLGNVNRFTGHVQDGVLDAGGVPFAVAGATGSGDSVGYVRPHDLEVLPFVEGETGLPVRLVRAYAIGALAQLELERLDTGDIIEAVVPNELYGSWNLGVGAHFLVRPRRLKVFPSVTATQAV
jgi:sulfate transport system ATP-binding protein